MSNKEYYEIPNGDYMEVMWKAKCPYCGKMVDCSWPSYETDDETVICTDCAFIHGHITEEELREIDYTYTDMARIAIHDGKVIAAFNNVKFPWEKTDIAPISDEERDELQAEMAAMNEQLAKQQEQ